MSTDVCGNSATLPVDVCLFEATSILKKRLLLFLFSANFSITMFMSVVLGAIGLALVYVFLKVFRRGSVNLRQKHVFITGGSKGIGRSLAVEAIKAGANVTIVARNTDDLDAAKLYILKQVENSGEQKVLTFALDVTSDLFTIEQAVSEAESELGPVFVLINCAGTSISQRFDETPLAEFRRMMEINYMGSVVCTQAILPSMKAQKQGHIVFVSSVAGLVGLYGYSAYSASKFAIVGLAEALSMEVCTCLPVSAL